MAKVDVRRAAKEDIPRLIELFEENAPYLEPWVYPPRDVVAFVDGSPNLLLVIEPDEQDIAGYFNLTGIIMGHLQQAFLGYAAFRPHAGKGYMSEGLVAVLAHAFQTLGLHRIEANVQPGNRRSKSLIRRHGFVCEGYSENYLRIGGVWRDHERWAITYERWRSMK